MNALSTTMRLLALLPMVVLFRPAAPLAAQGTTGLTIYNDGRVLVRRTIPAQVPKGASEQHLMLGALDPSTLFSLDSTVVFTEARYDGAVDEPSVLRRAVGRRLTLQSGSARDTVVATLLGVDPERYRLADGSITFGRPGTLRYPEDLVVIDPTASLMVRSAAARSFLGVGYFTGGAAWEASYQVVLGGAAARVIGAAVIPSRTLRAESADIQLLAGAVSRSAPEQRPMARAMRTERMEAYASEAKQVSEERVGEFHLYTLPGKWTLLPGVTSSIALFEPAGVNYERGLVVRGQLPYWGFFPQRGDEEIVPVEVSYTLKRPRKTDFGDRPLPGGVARIYQADSAGRQQLVGEATVEHTPAGTDLRLGAGEAFDLTAKRVQTNYVTRRDTVKAGGWHTSATADYTVTITNATDSAATVDVREERAGEWVVVSSSVPPVKLSSTVTRFRVRVPARADARLTYRVRVSW